MVPVFAMLLVEVPFVPLRLVAPSLAASRFRLQFPGRASRQAQQEVLELIEIDLSGCAATDEVPVVTVAFDLNTEANRVLAVRPGNLIGGFPVGTNFATG